MNKWEILGIEPTHDVKIIRKRYSELVKLYHPEDQPEIYQQIVEAYQSALRGHGLIGLVKKVVKVMPFPLSSSVKKKREQQIQLLVHLILNPLSLWRKASK